MKHTAKITLMLTLLGTIGSVAHAHDYASADTKEMKSESRPTPNFGAKEQKDLDAILSELSRQHANASGIVKANREPLSLATQSALVAHSTPTQSKNEYSIQQHLTEVASSTISKFKQAGIASWYGRQFHGKKTASGERFDMNALTAAHRSLPLGSYVKVTNKDNGQSVVVKINDRGPFHGNRILDLSYGAAKAIGLASKGMGNVTIERVDDPQTTQLALNTQ